MEHPKSRKRSLECRDQQYCILFGRKSPKCCIKLKLDLNLKDVCIDSDDMEIGFTGLIPPGAFSSEGTYDGLPADGTRLSKSLFKLASQLAVRGVLVERLRRGKQRGIRLYRR